MVPILSQQRMLLRAPQQPALRIKPATAAIIAIWQRRVRRVVRLQAVSPARMVRTARKLSLENPIYLIRHHTWPFCFLFFSTPPLQYLSKSDFDMSRMCLWVCACACENDRNSALVFVCLFKFVSFFCLIVLLRIQNSFKNILAIFLQQLKLKATKARSETIFYYVIVFFILLCFCFLSLLFYSFNFFFSSSLFFAALLFCWLQFSCDSLDDVNNNNNKERKKS